MTSGETTRIIAGRVSATMVMDHVQRGSTSGCNFIQPSTPPSTSLPRPPPTMSSGPAVPESCFPPSPFAPMRPFRGPRPVRETAGGQSALTSGPAPAHRRPTRQRPRRCPSTETSADSTGPAARRSAPTRVELPLLRGQPGTTRRVVPLLAIRWSHDRGKTRHTRSHERGKRQCAAAHAKPSAVPQVEVAPMAATQQR